MTRSDPASAMETGVPAADNPRATLVAMVQDRLHPSEPVVAVFPYTNTEKRPRQPGETRKDKVRIGIHQSWRRYRPMVVTDRRLFVFETGRTPHPREVLAELPLADVELVEVAPGRMGATRFVLDIAGTGRVPFECGRKERHDLDVLREVLGGG